MKLRININKIDIVSIKANITPYELAISNIKLCGCNGYLSTIGYRELNNIGKVAAPQPRRGFSIIIGIELMYISNLGSFIRFANLENLKNSKLFKKFFLKKLGINAKLIDKKFIKNNNNIIIETNNKKYLLDKKIEEVKAPRIPFLDFVKYTLNKIKSE